MMASGVAPERQRVRIQNKHPNPLFESLLMKWIKQASENENAKMVHNYKLALSSLKRYPLPLPSGKHCISLKYFGLKCCERLDRDMNRILTDPSCPRGTDGKVDFYALVEQRSDLPTPWDERNGPPKRKRSKTPKKILVSVAAEAAGPSNNSTVTPTAQKKNYIPRYRSGGYAILRAMYELGKGDSTMLLNKDDIITLAQNYCEASFVVPENNAYYSAWNSMGTLRKHVLVENLRVGACEMYSLTVQGAEVGRKFSLEQTADLYPPSAKKKSRTPSIPVEEVADEEADIPFCAPSTSGACAVVTLSSSDEELKVVQREKRSHVENVPRTVHSMSDSSGGEEEGVAESSLNCSPDKEEEVRDCVYSSPQAGHSRSGCEDEGHFVCPSPGIDDGRYLLRPLTPLTPSPPASRPGSPVQVQRSSSSPPGAKSLQSSKNCDAGALSFFRDHSPRTRSCSTPAPAHIESSEDQPAKLPLPRPVSFPQDESEVRQFQLAPGQFEVTLIVDSCEVGSKAVRTARDTIVDELVRRGVKHQVRRLSVGDFLWIALAPNDSELVLPWIVERKRLDDLAGSIKDGRWKEQKFRLKQSGLDVFYMVEEFRWKSHLGLPEETVRQAVMNTWLIDGFQVINSKNTLNSVEWLQKMTNQLVLKYSQLTLESANQEVFVSQKQGQEAPKTKLMPFTYVQLLCAKKTKKLTVRDQFAKSLMVLAGVSVDKAAAITNVYPTPLLLRQAFQNTEGEKAKANLLAKIKYGIGERCIGPKISNALYLLYGTDGPS